MGVKLYEMVGVIIPRLFAASILTKKSFMLWSLLALFSKVMVQSSLVVWMVAVIDDAVRCDTKTVNNLLETDLPTRYCFLKELRLRNKLQVVAYTVNGDVLDTIMQSKGESEKQKIASSVRCFSWDSYVVGFDQNVPLWKGNSRCSFYQYPLDSILLVPS